MPAELFALSTAFFSALHNVCTKTGSRYSNPATAVVAEGGMFDFDLVSV